MRGVCRSKQSKQRGGDLVPAHPASSPWLRCGIRGAFRGSPSPGCHSQMEAHQHSPDSSSEECTVLEAPPGKNTCPQHAGKVGIQLKVLYIRCTPCMDSGISGFCCNSNTAVCTLTVICLPNHTHMTTSQKSVFSQS